MSIAAVSNGHGFQSSDVKGAGTDYAKVLQKKYSYCNSSARINGVQTSVSVSSSFLEKCAKDPEKAAYLEENLAAIPDCISSLKAKCLGTITNVSYQIDSNGEITAIMSGTNDPDGKIARENAEKKIREQQAAKKWHLNGRNNLHRAKSKSVKLATERLIKNASLSNNNKLISKVDSIEISEEGRLAAEQEKAAQAEPAADEEEDEVSESQGGKVGINAGKLARMLAAAKTRSQVQAVVAKIQADLNQCDAGKEQGMDVDETSVQAAEQLLQQAKSRMGSAENREATPEEELASALAGLM